MQAAVKASDAIRSVVIREILGPKNKMCSLPSFKSDFYTLLFVLWSDYE